MIDKIIIGAGLYGLYSALFCAKRGQKVLVLEQEQAPFTRATYINQARVHMGYHYPRSLSTAMKSAGYFRRFVEDYGFCIHSEFQQVYATSSHFSWTDATEFRRFCKNAGIPCMDLPIEQYFKEGVCDGAFLTQEYTYDAHILRDYFLEQLERFPNVEIRYGQRVERIIKKDRHFEVLTIENNREVWLEAPFILNATYASVNQVLRRLEGVEPELFDLKYELCEIILCRVGEELKNIGLTVMDGPFFSIMPFGKTGYHSLTSVTFTPHNTCYEEVPHFACTGGGADGKRIVEEEGTGGSTDGKRIVEEEGTGGSADGKRIVEEEGTGGSADGKHVAGNSMDDFCTVDRLGNCSLCERKPESAWEYMSALARKYIREELNFEYDHSLFSMKPILKASEIDDSRPTVIRFASQEPVFVSVLSGKINTVYDLDDILEKE